MLYINISKNKGSNEMFLTNEKKKSMEITGS
jgi:hypothetical protein